MRGWGLKISTFILNLLQFQTNFHNFLRAYLYRRATSGYHSKHRQLVWGLVVSCSLLDRSCIRCFIIFLKPFVTKAYYRYFIGNLDNILAFNDTVYLEYISG